MLLCGYGCGKIATHQFKNGNWACSNNVMKCPNIANKSSSSIKEIWKDPTQRFVYEKAFKNRDKTIFKTAFKKPEIREKRKRITSKRYDDPEERRKQSERMLVRMKDKKTRKKIGIASKNNWKNPDYRNKTTNSIKLSWNDEDRKKEMSKRAKKWWTKERREKQRKRLLDGHAIYMNSCISVPTVPQKQLFNLCQELFPYCIIEYPCYNTNRSIDIAIPQLSIAVEYDGSHWHPDKESDLERQKQLEEQGWIFVRYMDYIPTKEKLLKDVNKALIKEWNRKNS